MSDRDEERILREVSVVREGERVGVPTPVNRTLVACVKGIEARRFGKED